MGGGQGTSHLGEAKSQRPVGFGLSCNLEMSSHPRLHFYVRYQGNGKSRNQQSDADQEGLSEEPVCWFPKAFKEVVYFHFSGNPRGPGRCPQENMTGHSITVDTQEHQPGSGMGSLWYLSGKILEDFLVMWNQPF